jgi:hypothetical protein
MHETSGVLRQPVAALLHGDPLSDHDIGLLRAYLWQWVKSPVWAPSGMLEALRLRVAAIRNQEDVRACVAAAVEMGMEPL